jgi:hypothetical protein
MKMLGRLGSLRASLLCAVAVLFLMAADANAQSTVGTVTQVNGVVNVHRGGATLAAVPRLPVQLHDRIVTEMNSSATITMVDNSSLRLGEQSTLTIDESVMINGVGAASKVGLLGGTIHTLITGAMRGSATSFEVHTPNAVGAVRGTEWDTTFADGVARSNFPNCLQFTDVEVQEGTVNVSNSAGSQDVHAGHKTTVPCFAAPIGEGAAAGMGAAATAGAVALGVGVVGGATFGGLEAAGALGSSNSPPGCKGKTGPPCGPKSPKQ